MINIKYFGFVKESASLPTCGLTLDPSIQAQLKIQIPKVIIKLKELQVIKDQRQRIKSQYGVWFCKKDAKGIIYFTLCINTYPERHIYAAINLMKTHLQQLSQYQNQPDATLRLHCKEKMTQICQKYQRIQNQNLDRISQANKVLGEIKTDITDSTLKLMNNTVNLQTLQRNAESLKDNALMFETNAAVVEREMYCRNCKMKVIIALVAVALICVIVIPIVTTVGKK